MKLIIFGATGSIGRELVKQALDQGHEVTAFTRNPAQLDSIQEELSIVQGDVLEPASVRAAVRGQDAVLVALGGGGKKQVRANGTRNIIEAMKEESLRRIICLSSLGVGDSRDQLNFFWKYIMFGLFLRKAYQDHQQQEKYVQGSDLDWTIIRPVAFTNGEHTGRYKSGFFSADEPITGKISRADVADFMLKQLTDDRFLHKTSGLSY